MIPVYERRQFFVQDSKNMLYRESTTTGQHNVENASAAMSAVAEYGE